MVEAKDQPELDIITQKEKGASDEKLLEAGCIVLNEKLAHLPWIVICRGSESASTLLVRISLMESALVEGF